MLDGVKRFSVSITELPSPGPDGKGVAPQQHDKWSPAAAREAAHTRDQDTASIGPSTTQRPLYARNSQQASFIAFQAKPPTEEFSNANNTGTGVASNPPDREEQPIQAEAPYQTRSRGSRMRQRALKTGCPEEVQNKSP